MTSNINRLIELMAQLRDPIGGCPWDVEQTFASIVPHTIEEAYEVADAIEQDDMPALEDELGDLLLQVVFHAQMAREAGLFDFDSVAGAICDKLIRRHPHVFGDANVADAEAQTRAWEDHKAAERAHEQKIKQNNGGESGDRIASALDGVTTGLPALTRALKLQKRAARVGFDWPDASGPLAKIGEETVELEHEILSGGRSERLREEVGDILFTCVNLARKLGLDPETALRRGNRKFESRFHHLESALAREGLTPKEVSLDRLESLWQQAKGREK
ncbi:MAG: nucleoside triphosphate pyrophosphohydrolase [Rhodospirillales bacterium]|nr:nucleoside triphosphate pyrophosphohydrolase [Rhodospirillales bacterium]